MNLNNSVYLKSYRKRFVSDRAIHEPAVSFRRMYVFFVAEYSFGWLPFIMDSAWSEVVMFISAIYYTLFDSTSIKDPLVALHLISKSLLLLIIFIFLIYFHYCIGYTRLNVKKWSLRP